MAQFRTYPQVCTSMYCDKSGKECNATCACYQALAQFKKWKEDHKAVQIDPVYHPSVWMATKER